MHLSPPGGGETKKKGHAGFCADAVEEADDDDAISTLKKARHSGIAGCWGFTGPSVSARHGNQLHTNRTTMKKSCFHGDDDAVESSEAQMNMLKALKRTGLFMKMPGKLCFEGSGTICFLNVQSSRRSPARI